MAALSQWRAQWQWPAWGQFFAGNKPAQSASPSVYDGTLITCALALMAIGLVMVMSASIPEAQKNFGNPYHYAIRHGVFLGLALVVAGVVMHVPMYRWQQSNSLLLLIAFVLLFAVLIIGRKVNGSTRWLALGPINIQVAELAKLFFFSYLAGYLVRRHDEVRENVKGFIKPLAVFFVIAFLLVLQPDLGTVIVMLVTTMGMLFLAGAKLWQFAALVMSGVGAVVLLIVFSPYRLRRVTSFWDPWADPFGSGYQLTQSLMAFGRGSWFGEGLGNSIQKLSYLPEAHTDFVIAILAEELGFVGVVGVVMLLAVVVFRGLLIGREALNKERYFEGFFASGIGIWLCFQGVVNIGASAGLLPTKGLTLPLVSYGGSSMVTLSIAIAILVRIDHEMKMASVQALGGRSK
ncbi:cell division protein FtsW [Neiella marina]|uniref:Probable peptidoglycan glycosyltransferase FtsW n=1 Tax=Neiella holothuriorum TaxID=2870530 RepID=A0ABS7EB18_9GAMM|nr:cell division protein FtsW [Neiella holothuriorum]